LPLRLQFDDQFTAPRTKMPATNGGGVIPFEKEVSVGTGGTLHCWEDFSVRSIAAPIAAHVNLAVIILWMDIDSPM
jgi:hypothetical protein